MAEAGSQRGEDKLAQALRAADDSRGLSNPKSTAEHIHLDKPGEGDPGHRPGRHRQRVALHDVVTRTV